MVCPRLSECDNEVTEEHFKTVCKKNYETCPFYKVRKPREWRLLEVIRGEK